MRITPQIICVETAVLLDSGHKVIYNSSPSSDLYTAELVKDGFPKMLVSTGLLSCTLDPIQTAVDEALRIIPCYDTWCRPVDR